MIKTDKRKEEREGKKRGRKENMYGRERKGNVGRKGKGIWKTKEGRKIRQTRKGNANKNRKRIKNKGKKKTKESESWRKET